MFSLWMLTTATQHMINVGTLTPKTKVYDSSICLLTLFFSKPSHHLELLFAVALHTCPPSNLYFLYLIQLQVLNPAPFDLRS